MKNKNYTNFEIKHEIKIGRKGIMKSEGTWEIKSAARAAAGPKLNGGSG